MTTETKETNVSRLINKSLNQELRLATFIVLESQADDGTTSDLHGDTYTDLEIQKACLNFNSFCGKSSLMHLVNTTGFTFAESYIALADMTVGEQVILKGSWVATIHCNDESIWDCVKSGELNGLSIQALAKVTPIEE
jgi:hypothetical protein